MSCKTQVAAAICCDRGTQEPLLRITGIVQNVDNVIHVKAERIRALRADSVPRGVSHDFH
jgi:hypothetical protein